VNKAYGLCEKEEVCIQGVNMGNLKERIQLEDLDVDGKILLKWILNRVGGC
jgi:hypothetical protein